METADPAGGREEGCPGHTGPLRAASPWAHQALSRGHRPHCPSGGLLVPVTVSLSAVWLWLPQEWANLAGQETACYSWLHVPTSHTAKTNETFTSKWPFNTGPSSVPGQTPVQWQNMAHGALGCMGCNMAWGPTRWQGGKGPRQSRTAGLLSGHSHTLLLGGTATTVQEADQAGCGIVGL